MTADEMLKQAQTPTPELKLLLDALAVEDAELKLLLDALAVEDAEIQEMLEDAEIQEMLEDAQRKCASGFTK